MLYLYFPSPYYDPVGLNLGANELVFYIIGIIDLG
jgi:hypothetical protein